MLLAVNFFDYIINYFTLIFDFITNFISGILNLFIIIPSALSLPASLVGMVPGIIGSSISLVVGIGVFKLILGWGNT